tara:strand:- start:1477 stop:2088 length:612 start_codon:yes stop_codon:yes gene_type:complete
MNDADQPVVMVSSSVYQNESLLDQIYGSLIGFGYSVWMSHKGTIPVNPGKSNFENCIEAVENCDIFLGLVTPFYGSGRNSDGFSITHLEQRRAVELRKPRWFVSDYRVNFARQLLRQYRFTKQNKPRRSFKFAKTPVMDHEGVLDMYEEAVLLDSGLPVEHRPGIWVHDYRRPEEALFYISEQLRDLNRIQSFLNTKEAEDGE